MHIASFLLRGLQRNLQKPLHLEDKRIIRLGNFRGTPCKMHVKDLGAEFMRASSACGSRLSLNPLVRLGAKVFLADCMQALERC